MANSRGQKREFSLLLTIDYSIFPSFESGAASLLFSLTIDDSKMTNQGDKNVKLAYY